MVEVGENVENKEQFKSLLDRNEIRRLQLAARDKDLRKLSDWAAQFEESISKEFDKIYKKRTDAELERMIDIIYLTIIYTLHFNESTMFGKRRINSFMEDLIATVNNFNDGSYSVAEYREILAKDGIETRIRNEGGDSNETMAL